MEYRQALKKVHEHNLIITVGNEPFYRDQVRNRVISLNKDCEVVKIDAEEVSEQEIFSSILFRDLFRTKRVFCISNFNKIKNIDFFISKNFSDVLILDSDSKGKSKSFKELEKISLCIECIKPKIWEQEEDAVSKINGYITNSGYLINTDAAHYLYLNIGYNLHKLMKEMQKLVLFKSESSLKIITKEDIDKICVLGLSYNIFDLIEKIINDEKKEALEAMDKIFKFESSPAILLINLWYAHFENLLYLKTSASSSLNTEIIKLPPSVVDKKLRPQAKKLNVAKILESLNFLTDIDHGLRKGSFDLRFYLEQFILKF